MVLIALDAAISVYKPYFKTILLALQVSLAVCGGDEATVRAPLHEFVNVIREPQLYSGSAHLTRYMERYIS